MQMKGFMSVVLLLTVQHVAAQRPWRIDYGVSAGATKPTYVLENIRSGVSREASSTYNGHLGGWVMFSPNSYVGLQTGISVAGLGAVLKKSEFGSHEVLQHTYWLQVPLSLVGKLPLRDSSNFFITVGLYGGLGVFGKNYIPDSYDGNAQQTFAFGENGSQQRTDYGALLNLGYRLRSGYSLSIGYQYGKLDVAPSQAAFEQRNRAYVVTIGYQLSSK